MRRTMTFMLSLLLSLVLILPAAAAGEGMQALSPDTWGVGLDHVTDQADILTGGQEEALERRAREISDAYGCQVYIVTMDDFTRFSSGWSIETCAEEIRTGYDLDKGGRGDLVLLLLSMADRDFDLMAHGDFGNASFTDYGKTVVATAFLDDFRDDDWYGGFNDYLDQCERLLKLSSKGKPLDVYNAPEVTALAAVISVLLGTLIALFVSLGFKSGMKSTAEKKEAGSYIPAGGVDITYRYDQFTHTTETRVYDPPQSKSGGGGGSHGGTSVGHSGSSHHSGKF